MFIPSVFTGLNVSQFDFHLGLVLVVLTQSCPGLVWSTESPSVELDVLVRNGLMIKAGEPLKLPAVVTGRPQPEVKWTKDEADPDPKRVQVETEGCHTTLFIKTAARSDHGNYTVTGTNSGGTKSAETRVDVMGES